MIAKVKETLLTLPSLLWLGLFFVIPSLIIFIYAFKPSTPYGGVGDGWTLQTIKNLYSPYFLKLIWNTFCMSFTTTAICLFLALPTGYHIATLQKKWRNILLLLIILPFWSSFLIRIFAWKTILHPEGIFHKTLELLGIISATTPLLYTSFSVLIVMVYTFLPFALLPIYTSASKFNFQLIEAAMDLGATRTQAFLKIFIPSISKGISTATMMVFIPAFGTYVIPDLVGGIGNDMIGNKIVQKTFIERNLPQASATSLFLALFILVLLAVFSAFVTLSKAKRSRV